MVGSYKNYLLFQQNLGDYSIRIEETTGLLYEVIVATPKGRFTFALVDDFDTAEKMANRIAKGINQGRRINYEPN